MVHYNTVHSFEDQTKGASPIFTVCHNLSSSLHIDKLDWPLWTKCSVIKGLNCMYLPSFKVNMLMMTMMMMMMTMMIALSALIYMYDMINAEPSKSIKHIMKNVFKYEF